MKENILTKNFTLENAYKIDVYLNRGGYQAVQKALKMKPDDILKEVKAANLRGRGGAGFPAGIKWGFVPKETEKPKYLCANADEGEPGTFKDRYIMTHDPHLLLEGIIISCYGVGIHKAYIYLRGEYEHVAQRLEQAVSEAYEHNYLGSDILNSGFNLDLHIHKGAGAYICGEETGLLESLEGKRGHPRVKPPFPAAIGLFNCPTVINNVETLSNIPYIILNGADKYLQKGLPQDGGTRIFSVSGMVKKPGVYELPLGTKLKDIIYKHAGGLKEGKKLKAVIPGGLSAPVLTPEEIDIPMDFDSLAEANSMLGSAAIIVIDQKTSMLEVLKVITNFYSHESCGQCTPCRIGTSWISKIVHRIRAGKGKKNDLDNIIRLASSIQGKTLCPLGDAAALPILSLTHKFKQELQSYVES